VRSPVFLTFCCSLLNLSCSPPLRTPEHSFDVHVLRTFTRELNAWIVRLQATSPHASDTINQVIYALNHTFHDVEQSYLIWRNERVQTILQHGFQYARARIQAALYRRERGRPAATFPAIFPSFQFAQYAGGSNPSPTRGLPPAQADGSYYQANTYGVAAPAPNPWNSPQPQAAQFPTQNTYPRRTESLSPQHPGALAGYAASGFAPDGAAGRMIDYPPPAYPPTNWKPPDPVPGSAPVPPGATAAVEVAIRYLEAVNKAINICIDLDAM
jgi:hypothetical protein